MMCEWLWLAMILVLTASLSLPDAVRMATRLVCAMRALFLAMAVWKRDAVCEASLYRLCVIALADELPLPLAAVTTLGGRRSVWVQGLMICTIQTVCQIGTAGVLAWLLTFPWHKVHLRIQRKPMWNTTGLSVSFL